MHGSLWRIQLPGVEVAHAADAVSRFLAAEQVLVSRMLKTGHRELDARAPVLSLEVTEDTRMNPASPGVHIAGCAILMLVVRQVTPAVRPDDVLAALGAVAGLALIEPPVAVRLAQGPLDGFGVIGDPLAVDRAAREASL
jgi:hypothetical protein